MLVPGTSPNLSLNNPAHHPFFQGNAMEIRHILIIMFVVFGLFVLANWFNRPKK